MMPTTDKTQEIAQENLDFSQDTVKLHLAIIILQHIWPRHAKKIIDLAAKITQLPDFDLLTTDFNKALQNIELRAILKEKLTKDEFLFLPDLELAKHQSKEIFEEIILNKGVLQEKLKKQLIEVLIKNNDLFDQKFFNELLDEGYCAGFTAIWLLAMAIEHEKIPELQKDTDKKDKEDKRFTPKKLKEILAVIVKCGFNDQLSEENLTKIEEFLALTRLFQLSIELLKTPQSKLTKIAEIVFGAKIEKPKNHASILLVCSKEELKTAISMLVKPKNLMYHIGIEKHDLAIYHAQEGIWCYDSNDPIWKICTNLDEWIDKLADHYKYPERFFVEVDVTSLTYEGNYSEEVALDGLLAKQNPNEKIHIASKHRCTLFADAALQNATTTLTYFCTHKKAEIQPLINIADKSDIQPLGYAIFHNNLA